MDTTEQTKPHDEAFTEAQTGAESTYVHGGQRPIENPPRGTGEDVSATVADELNEMHVDSKLTAQEGQTLPERAEDESREDLERRRAEALQDVDAKVEARKQHAANVAAASDANRDRTLAVQEEIATRERDGAMPGTPAFARRQEAIRSIVEGTGDVERPAAERIRDIAATLHTRSPGALESAQHDLMAIAEELDKA